MIYQIMSDLYFEPANSELKNPHFILGIDAAKELRLQVEHHIGKKSSGAISTFGGWCIIVDPNEDKDTCMVMHSEYPVDSYWEE